MDLRKLKTLIDLVSESNVSELEITEAEGKVRIVKGGGAVAHAMPGQAYAAPLQVAPDDEPHADLGALPGARGARPARRGSREVELDVRRRLTRQRELELVPEGGDDRPGEPDGEHEDQRRRQHAAVPRGRVRRLRAGRCVVRGVHVSSSGGLAC